MARVKSFELAAGRKIGANYEVVDLLGSGSEGEVYRIVETQTGIHRAAKLYFPGKGQRYNAAVWYARKLNTLRNCRIVLQYNHTERIQVRGRKVLCLVSELCEGTQLERWIAEQQNGRLPSYVALNLLYHLALGLEGVHGQGEYHADVHTQNILVAPAGVRFQLKLVDFYNWGRPSRRKRQQDILDAITVFYECLGGRAQYAHFSPEVRYILAAFQMRRTLRRFPTMTALRVHLQSFAWTQLP